MRTVALISGGKDSCYNMMQCVGAGHSIVALANLQPVLKDELDSYMYQTVGHQGIEFYAEAMGLPLYREAISGVAVDQGRNYKPTVNDEVEDLYRLLLRIKNDLDVEAVSCGAILSDYQRVRVENVCQRLGLVSLAYLWRRNQKELLQEMISSGVEAIIIKVAALGLDPRVHLGMTLKEIQPHLLVMQEKYGLNVCGEGGEYETFTLDCPLFKKQLVIDEKKLIIHSEDSVASVGYLNLKLHVEPKADFNGEIILPPAVKNAFDFKDLSDSVFSDISDIEESELESIEKLKIEEEKKQKELHPLISYEGNVNIRADDVDNSNEDVTEDGYYYDEGHNENDRFPIIDHSSIYGNGQGWFYIGGIVGEASDTAKATEDAINKLINLLQSKELQLEDVCSVNIYMRDMGQYADLNAVYVKAFSFANPPTRVCVQCPLPNEIGLIIDAVAHKCLPSSMEGDSNNSKERVTMHVQGISHWAPANIGPYSQAVKIGEVVGTCGQIALVPGTMRLVEGSARVQCSLALRHLTRVIRAAHPRAHIRSVVQSVCYVVSGGGRGGAREARRQLERRTAGAMVQCAVVGALPRNAMLEWHAWAHTDNNRFDYEETGCNVGEYKVAITRRWNYENTVAAIVCYVATGSSPSTCQLWFPDEATCRSHRELAASMSREDLEAVLEYALKKLLNECQQRESDPALSVRIFYQVWSAPPPSVMVSATYAAGKAMGARVAVTCVPVLALHNAFSFLSISGLRFDE
ncbi:diphthine--ammonia ligase isoform X1 [Pieris brassicae]|uniref:diphthine--ammonia ligase isoform X1 n=1 Tax=Pieris brassicae TaxID=7116 RepID=UPI001E66126E|nr:diphthine--ammonia ligase isoform X1 [Pieris brassicae]